MAYSRAALTIRWLAACSSGGKFGKATSLSMLKRDSGLSDKVVDFGDCASACCDEGSIACDALKVQGAAPFSMGHSDAGGDVYSRKIGMRRANARQGAKICDVAGDRVSGGSHLVGGAGAWSARERGPATTNEEEAPIGTIDIGDTTVAYMTAAASGFRGWGVQDSQQWLQQCHICLRWRLTAPVVEPSQQAAQRSEVPRGGGGGSWSRWWSCGVPKVRLAARATAIALA